MLAMLMMPPPPFHYIPPIVDRTSDCRSTHSTLLPSRLLLLLLPVVSARPSSAELNSGTVRRQQLALTTTIQRPLGEASVLQFDISAAAALLNWLAEVVDVICATVC